MWNHKRLLLSYTPATTKHYAICQFQVSVIRYSYHLTAKWLLCVLLIINNLCETINGCCCHIRQLQQSIMLPVRLYIKSSLYLRVVYYIRTTCLSEGKKTYDSWMRFMLSHVHACSYLRYELCFSVLLQYGTILSQAWIGPGFYWICIECCFSTCLETALTLSKRGCQKHYADNESLAMWAHVSMQSIWSIRKYFTNCCIQESRSYNNTCTHVFFFGFNEKITDVAGTSLHACYKKIPHRTPITRRVALWVYIYIYIYIKNQ
jgi:hypothetical protein